MAERLENLEIPALDQAYAHARRAYGLVSALLIAWELIGIELESSPLQHVKLTLKSPQAAPYVLIVLIIYFGLRATIEWYQNDIRRRRMLASRIDFAMSHIIAIAALALYGFQTLSRVQLANIVTRAQLLVFVLGNILSLAITDLVRDGWPPRNKISATFQSIVTLGVTCSLGYLIIWRDVLNIPGALFIGLAGMALGILTSLFLRWLDRRARLRLNLSSAEKRT